MDRLGNLKEKKRNLLVEKEKIISEKPSKFKKILYVFGIGVTGVLSSIAFLNTTPSLIFCMTYLYTVLIPMIYIRRQSNKLDNVLNKLLDVQYEIELLERLDINRCQKKSEIDLCRDFKEKYVRKNVISNDRCNQEEKVDDGPKLRLRM